MKKDHPIALLFDTAGQSAYASNLYAKYASALSDILDIYCIHHVKFPPNNKILYGNTISLSDENIFYETSHHKDVSRGLIPGNPDLKIVRAIRELPTYDLYIRIEYDVYCTSDIKSTFSSLISAIHRYDFSASYICPHRNDGWQWWSSLQLPEGVKEKKSQILTRAFLPLMSFSRRYIEQYVDDLRNGMAGHYEVTMASSSVLNGFSTFDLSHANPPFTHYPQFSVKPVSELDSIVPQFVHPVKSQADADSVARMLTMRT